MYKSWMEICPQIGWWRPRPTMRKEMSNERPTIITRYINLQIDGQMNGLRAVLSHGLWVRLSESNEWPKEKYYNIRAEKKTTVSSERNAKCVWDEARLCEFCFLSIWIKIREKKYILFWETKDLRKWNIWIRIRTQTARDHITSIRRRRHRWTVAQWKGIAHKSLTRL